MKKQVNLFLFSAILFIILSLITGCKSNTITAADETAVRTYADPATEMTLQGLSEDNLAKYTQYGNTGFNTAVTQPILDTTATKINNQYGTFVSVEFQSTEQQQGYIIVYYKAQYTKGSTTVRMVFDTDQKVAGQWFQ